jgi:hypothetical protein
LIQEELKKEAKWSVDKLIFEIPGSPPFDIIPSLGGLGEVPKVQEKLSFAHPPNMTHDGNKEANFQGQALPIPILIQMG